MCPYKDGAKCTDPDTDCPHWQGTFCELDKIEQGGRLIELDYK